MGSVRPKRLCDERIIINQTGSPVLSTRREHCLSEGMVEALIFCFMTKLNDACSAIDCLADLSIKKIGVGNRCISDDIESAH